jgi:predicted nucleic acid-binding protein
MTVVVDASVVVAALLDTGPDGRWAEQVLAGGSLVAPHLMPVEVANILRRAQLSGDVTSDLASLAHADLLALPFELFGYAEVGPRVWQLRATVTAYDATYVALAELLSCSLATLDRRLSRASGPKCSFQVPTSPRPR